MKRRTTEPEEVKFNVALPVGFHPVPLKPLLNKTLVGKTVMFCFELAGRPIATWTTAGLSRWARREFNFELRHDGNVRRDHLLALAAYVSGYGVPVGAWVIISK